MKTLKTIFLALIFLGALSAADVRLDWTDNSNNESGFAIERAPAGTNPVFVEIFRTAANVVTYTDVGLPNSTSYVYRVRAFNSAGNSSYSNQASVTTSPPAVTIPAAPTNLTATAL
jgi:PAB1-binding protein PBP1